MEIGDSPQPQSSQQLNRKQPAKINDFFKPTTTKRSKPDLDDSSEESSTMASGSDLSALAALMSGFKDEIKNEIRATGELQMQKMEEWRAEVQSQLGDIKTRMENVEATTAATSNDLSALASRVNAVDDRINDSEQSRLSTHITVSGIRRETVEPRRNDATTFAHELLQSLGIVYNAGDVASAYIFQLARSKDFRLTIIFHTIQAKAEVLRQKRDRGAGTGIYFEHAMIPPVRKLLLRARQVAKSSSGLKYAVLKSNRVCVVKADDSLIAISNDADIDAVAAEFPPDVQPTSSTAPPRRSSQQSLRDHLHSS